MNNTYANQSLNVTGRRVHQDFSSFYIATGVCETLLMPVIIFSNLVIISSILTNRTLRQDFRHLGMVSVSIADLFTGLITCPIVAEYTFNGGTRFECAKYFLVASYDMYVQKFVVTWGIVSLNANYLLTLHCVKMRLSPFMRKFLIVMFLALPWLAMFVVVLPLAYIHAGSVYLSRICILRMPKSAHILVVCFAVVVPAIIAILQLIHILILYRCRRSGEHMHTVTNNSDASQNPWMFVCATVATFLMIFPQETLSVFGSQLIRSSNIYTYAAIATASTIVGDVKSAILPFIWCMEADVRSAVKNLYNRLPWRTSRHRSREEDTVGYRNF